MSEIVITVRCCQLPSLNWQSDWQPVNLDMRLEQIFPPLFRAGQGLNEEEQARLRSAVEEMQSCLALQPTIEQINNLLISLFSALQNPAKNHSTKTMLATYRFTLDGVSYPVLRKAIGDIIRGRAEGMSRIFLPTSAELMHYCDNLTSAAHGCIARAEQLLSAPEAVPVQRISFERIKQIQQEIRQAAQKQEAVGAKSPTGNEKEEEAVRGEATNRERKEQEAVSA